ncbi:hypothetical protein MOSE0_H02256 [Monosporozyma servazzii]
MAGEGSPRGVSVGVGAHPHTTCTRRMRKATPQELPDPAATPLRCCKTNGATSCLFVNTAILFYLFVYLFICFALLCSGKNTFMCDPAMSRCSGRAEFPMRPWARCGCSNRKLGLVETMPAPLCFVV